MSRPDASMEFGFSPPVLEALAVAQFGEPSQRTSREWRWGAHGSLALTLTGEKRGLWFNFETGEGGRLTEATEAPRATPKAEPRPKQATDYPRKIATRLRGLHGTLAERYLVEVRGIARPPGGWPHALGFDPVDRALTGVVRDDDGDVVAVHRVFLSPDGQKLDPAELPARRLRAVKQTNGPKGLGSLILGDSGTGWLCVVEGIETALAVHLATGFDVLVTLGTLAQAKRLPADRPLIFCVEDDAQGSPAARAAHARIASLIEAGREVRTAWPWPERRHDKSDLADVILAGGVDAVRARIEAATGLHGPITRVHDHTETVPEWVLNAPPQHGEIRPLAEVPWVIEPSRTVPLVEVQTAITRVTSEFFAAAHVLTETRRAVMFRDKAVIDEDRARRRAVRAEQVLDARLAERNAMVADLQEGIASGQPEGLREAARRAEWKVRRASVTANRRRERWIAAASKLGSAPTPFVPRVIVAAETGTAKTGITLKMAKAWIDVRKAQGLPHRIIWMVPALRPDVEIEPTEAEFAAFWADKATPRQRAKVMKALRRSHEDTEQPRPRNAKRLGEQALDRAREAGIDAAIFLGIDDDNCQDTVSVDLAKRAGADPASAVCGSLDGAHCAVLEWCLREGYKAGLSRAATADMVICAQNFAVENLPAKITEGVWCSVIDEDFVPRGDIAADLTLEALGREAFERSPVLGEDGEPDRAATDMLIERFAMIAEAARRTSGGYLSDAALTAAKFRVEWLAEMRRAVWAMKQRPMMTPGMSVEARQEEARRCKVNPVLGRMVALLHAVEGIISKGDAGAGLISVVTDRTKSGDHTRLVVRGRKPVANWLAGLPVLNLDATADLDLVRLMFPDATMPPIPKAERSHAETHQVLGRWGRRYLARHPEIITELTDLIRLRMIGKRSGLVIVYKDIEHLFAGIPNVETMHHGDVAGDDRHRGCDFLMVIGGAFANAEDAASLAAGRGAGAVPVAPPVPVTRTALLTSGAAVAMADVMGYADPGVDGTHRGIFDASVMQAAGRQDQFHRTAETTCETWVLANVILDRPVRTITWYPSVRPGRFHKMILAGTVLTNAAHMHTAYPDLYSTVDAAEAQRWRENGNVAGVIRDAREAVASDWRAWKITEYQPMGQGHGISYVMYAEGEGEAERAKLEAMLGSLKLWRERELTPGREEVLRGLYQALNRPVSTPSPDLDDGPPAWVVGDAPWVPSGLFEVEERPPDG